MSHSIIGETEIKICESALLAAHMALSGQGSDEVRAMAPALVKAALRVIDSEANIPLADGDLEQLLAAGFTIDPASLT